MAPHCGPLQAVEQMVGQQSLVARAVAGHAVGPFMPPAVHQPQSRELGRVEEQVGPYLHQQQRLLPWGAHQLAEVQEVLLGHPVEVRVVAGNVRHPAEGLFRDGRALGRILRPEPLLQDPPTPGHVQQHDWERRLLRQLRPGGVPAATLVAPLGLQPPPRRDRPLVLEGGVVGPNHVVLCRQLGRVRGIGGQQCDLVPQPGQEGGHSPAIPQGRRAGWNEGVLIGANGQHHRPQRVGGLHRHWGLWRGQRGPSLGLRFPPGCWLPKPAGGHADRGGGLAVVPGAAAPEGCGRGRCRYPRRVQLDRQGARRRGRGGGRLGWAEPEVGLG
mmetsp:Transcript_3879/g.6866  ORF Transcript_3879/g.6866 Transcript_3879/m.6866 type:complete len:328 (+) Transcript_3879:1684-2667(+)